ncbi:ATP-binding cassette domain-containing protein [Paenibacillus sp. BR2-3]|uniref:ATP-binding cassette domain-containing protein n=1 Tax=Paenibacillus sp. BR2-3 TaxID=3048494 RepID=UPI00397741FF
MAGLIQASEGRVIYGDKRAAIGYAPEVFPPLKFTPDEFLQSIGCLNRIAPAEIDHRIAELLAFFRLESFRSKSMVSFSKGMLQKVNLMQSMLAQPPLLLLDEPMSGLDSPAQDTLVQLVLELKRKGTAIIFSVHEPQWIEAMADDVHVLQAGRTVRTIQQSELLGSITSHIAFMGIEQHTYMQMQAMPGFLSANAPMEQQTRDCAAITVQSSSCDSFLRAILDAGGSVRSVERRGGLSGLDLWMSPMDSFNKEEAI